MKAIIVMLMLSLAVGMAAAWDPVKNQPVVGIIGQYGTDSLSKQYPSPTKYYTYVAGSYVDWVGISGAMPLLIPFDLPRSTLTYLLEHTDAFLIPGGGTPLEDGKGGPSDFQETVNFVLEWAKQKNDNGTYYPVWGTCNGFESLMVYWANTSYVLTCEFDDLLRDHAVIKNTTNFPNSKFWNSLNKSDMDYVFDNGYVFYDHNCGVSREDFFKYSKLDQNAMITAVSFNDKNVEFIAMAEDRKYPFFATQWHPEKNQFERGPLNEWLDKSTTTIKFLSEVIQELVDRVRSTSRTLEQIPMGVRPYFSMYQNPIVVGYNNFERVYLSQRFIADLKAHEEAEESLPIRDGPGRWKSKIEKNDMVYTEDIELFRLNKQ